MTRLTFSEAERLALRKERFEHPHPRVQRRMKSQMLQHLLNEGIAVIDGHHLFSGGNWAELVKCDGYSFHRPCPPIEGVVPEEREQIEAKPRGAKEPRLKAALHTIEKYLEGKPLLEVYRWPPAIRIRDSNRDYQDDSYGYRDLDDQADGYNDPNSNYLPTP